MKAAWIEREGASPRIRDDVPEPDGDVVVEVTAAAINPIDVTTAAGRFTVPAQYPYVPGKEGVGTLGGRRVYFTTGGGHGPGGAMAERAPAAETVDLPDGIEDAHAACYGIAGLAAWLALDWRGALREGETVLVLGASGAVGQVAVQAAKLLGSGRVVAAARSEEGLARARELGADETVGLESSTLADDLREATGGELSLVVDPLWGAPAEAAIEALAYGGRLVQIGRSAGESAQLTSAAIRGKQLSILGHQNFATPREDRIAAYTRMCEEAAAGRMRVDHEEMPLERVSEAWERQAASPGRKLVLIP